MSLGLEKRNVPKTLVRKPLEKQPRKILWRCEVDWTGLGHCSVVVSDDSSVEPSESITGILVISWVVDYWGDYVKMVNCINKCKILITHAVWMQSGN